MLCTNGRPDRMRRPRGVKLWGRQVLLAKRVSRRTGCQGLGTKEIPLKPWTVGDLPPCLGRVDAFSVTTASQEIKAHLEYYARECPADASFAVVHFRTQSTPYVRGGALAVKLSHGGGDGLT